MKVLIRTLFLMLIALVASGCGDAPVDAGEDESFVTRGQALSTSHEWSRAPAATGSWGAYWEVTATEVGPDDEVYVVGYISSDTKVDFGCGPVANPELSYNDSFLVKYDQGGSCDWQYFWKSDETEPGVRMGYVAHDVAVSVIGSETHVLVANERTVEPWDIYSGEFAYGGGVYEVVEDSATGQPQQVWADELLASGGHETTIVAIGVDEDDNLVATGSHDTDFPFANTPLVPGDGIETFVLRWGTIDNAKGDRAELWGDTFGGSGTNAPEDVAVDYTTGDFAVVGNYDKEHTSLDGDPAPTATNSSVFVQTHSFDNGTFDSLYSESASAAYDTEFATAAAFSPSGRLYVTGSFKGELDRSGLGDGNPFGDPLKADENHGDNRDWFIVAYNDALDLQADFHTWAQSGRIGGPDADWYIDRAHDIVATDYLVAITGRACDGSSGECIDTGFAHAWAVNDVDSTPRFSDNTINYDTQAYSGEAVAIDSQSRLIVVGGPTKGSNISFATTAPTLPGGHDFFVSYQLMNP